MVVGKLATRSPEKLAQKPLFQASTSPAPQSPPIVCKENYCIGPLFISPIAEGKLGAPNTCASPTTSKPESRRSPAQAREQRRVLKDRRANFDEATCFAYRMDWPLNMALTINWDSLIQAGEHNEGHCLGRDQASREAYLRRELARCRMKVTNVPVLIAIWGRAIGRQKGLHTHIAIFWPRRDLESLIDLLERVCGSPRRPMEQPHPADALMRSGNEAYPPNTLAISSCRGWLVQGIYGSSQLSGARKLTEYIADQSEKHPFRVDLKGKAFGVSESIGPRARAAHGYHHDDLRLRSVSCPP
jgi:hypothetical protein